MMAEGKSGERERKRDNRGMGGDVSLTWICCWRRLILCCCCRSCCCCLAICGEIAQKKHEIQITIPRVHPQEASTLLSSLNLSTELRNLQVQVAAAWRLLLKQGADVHEQFIANTSGKGNPMENIELDMETRTHAKISLKWHCSNSPGERTILAEKLKNSGGR